MKTLSCGYLSHEFLAVLWGTLCLAGTAGSAISAGMFPNERDIGNPAHSGEARYDSTTGSYEIRGGGANMWFTNDAFYFVWKPASDDFALSAAIDWLGSGGDPHRKACLLARQNATPGSPYIDVALHGDGLTSLQYREVQNGPTREIQLPQKHPLRVGLARQGETFAVTIDPGNGQLVPSGAFLRLGLQDPVLLGLGVCAHDNSRVETARFSAVELKSSAGLGTAGQLHCALETVAIASKDRKIVYHTTNHIEAPNWSRDGSYLLFNSKGRIYRLPLSGGDPAMIDTGFADRCNNDHGISPDGTQLVISDQSRTGKSLIYVLPITGGTPRQVTSLGPSYWHGWSPDGQTLAYCAERDNEYDVYTIPVEGGQETRLTTAKGLDDGPDYSADGQWIYFNSDRTGTMHIWRMRPDGSDQQQLTFDEFNNWFPHPSPDGKWVVFLSYEKDVTGHPANKNVWLRLMPLDGGPAQELARLFGGQGTINVPSWSPDSRQLAFVSYELLPESARPRAQQRSNTPSAGTMLFGAALSGTQAAQNDPSQSSTPEPQTKRDARMEWWREARFGMFVHWGLYSGLAGTWEGKPVGTKGGMEWIQQRVKADTDTYAKAAIPLFKPSPDFAREWARLAKAAGCRYLVFTTKHHDGFALHNSQVTDYDAGSVLQRDLVKEIVRAARVEGLRVGFYHSVIDWHHDQYEYARSKQLPHPLKGQPYPNGQRDHTKYQAFLHAQVKELVSRYPVDILWWDYSAVDFQGEEAWRAFELMDLVRAERPKIIMNNRLFRSREAGWAGMGTEGYLPQLEPKYGDFITPEQHIPATGMPGVDWETCMTMNTTWGYSEHDHAWKSDETLIRNLVDIASKGGNYLLNIGPKADGSVPEESVRSMQAIGAWMKVNGDAIYGTTASPFAKLDWGRCTQKARSRGNTRLYLHVFDWPQDGKLLVPGLQNEASKAFLLASGARVGIERQRDGLRLQVPASAPDRIASVIVLDIRGTPKIAAGNGR